MVALYDREMGQLSQVAEHWWISRYGQHKTWKHQSPKVSTKYVYEDLLFAGGEMLSTNLKIYVSNQKKMNLD